MTITDVIRNEIEDWMGHKPSRYEMGKFIDYLHDMVADKEHQGKKVFLKDVKETIEICLNECFCQCAGCGEWFLREDMDDLADRCKFCDND